MVILNSSLFFYVTTSVKSRNLNAAYKYCNSFFLHFLIIVLSILPRFFIRENMETLFLAIFCLKQVYTTMREFLSWVKPFSDSSIFVSSSRQENVQEKGL